MTDSGVRRRSILLAGPAWTALSWAVVLLCGAAQAISKRFYVNPDGVSYLNLSNAYTRGDYAGAVDAYWSPLYPWLIGQLRSLYNWPAYWESSVVHAVNLAAFLASYACFRFMLRELTEHQLAKKRQSPDREIITWQRSWEVIAAHALFLWSGLVLIGVSIVTPDMLIAAEVYLIAGLMMRILRGGSGLKYPGVLGLVLALSYLTKAVMFPISLLVIACAGWGKGAARWSLVQRATCALIFLILSAPQVVAVSRQAGRLSFGENGRITYALWVNHYPVMWTGSPPNSGVPAHPPRKILSNPDGYEFSSRNPDYSYPLWDEPAYWRQGIRPHFTLGQQAAAIRKSLSVYEAVFGTFFLGALILVIMGRRGRSYELWSVFTVALSPFVLYALVNVAPRLIAPWSAVLFLVVSSSIGFRAEISAGEGVRAVLIALAFWQLALVGSSVRNGLGDAVRSVTGNGPPHEYWRVARDVQRLGLRRGQKVASIGHSSESYWARLAGVQIAMEIPLGVGHQYWVLPAEQRARVNKVLSDHGAAMIVAANPPISALGPEWIRLGASAFYGLPLRQLPSSALYGLSLSPLPGVTNRR